MCTFKEYVTDVYLPYHHYNSKSEDNFNRDRLMVNVILSHEFTNKELNAVDKSDILLFLGSVHKKRKISQATVNRYRSRLLAIFNYAIAGGYINHNPVSNVKKHKESFRTRYLDKNEIATLLAACKESKNKELYSIVVMALNTGMRQGEILNLKNENHASECIYLSGKQTKAGCARTVPLNDASKSVINIKSDGSKENIFNSKSIRSAFDYAKKRAGIKQFRFHDLRRTFATYLKENNVDLHTIQQILGHSDITMTERYLGISTKKILDSVKIISFK